MKIRLLVILCSIAAMIAPARSDDRQKSLETAALAKLAPWVLEHTQDGSEAEVLVVLADQADLSGGALLTTKRQKARFVYNALWSKAQATQAPLLSLLSARKIDHRSYYIVNMIRVKAGRELALTLAARPEVRLVEGNPVIHTEIEQPHTQRQTPLELQVVGGNITNTRAPEVWALGYTGQGVVVAGADTGYRWDHVTLKPHYRGWDGITASHDFNWHDSIHSGGGACGGDSAQPCDDSGHGSHTMGTVVGDDGAGDQIGMAPGAKWIGCRNMDQGNGTPASYIECMEFFLAPYPVNGTPAQGNPAKAPDITTNSWTCPASEGCAPGTLQQAVEAQRAAGIMMAVAAGNSGPSCSTVIESPSFYDAAYSIGAFDHRTNNVASFSSRGPVTIDGSNRVKPDLSAPGVSVRSAWNSGTSAFNTISGTSMATPHVAGAVALLWSAQPALRGNVSFAEQILNNAAVHVSSTSCGSSGVPNNTYGYGRLDIKAAVDAALPCTSAPALSASSASFSASGGAGNVSTISVAGCGWIAESKAGWITITSGGSGTGNGMVNYSVSVNFGAARIGTITIAGRTFTVNQASPAFQGFHDGAGCNTIQGWAWDPNNPNSTVSVDIYDGNTLIGTAPANMYREDLLNAIGSPDHGFSFLTPVSMLDGGVHAIVVKFSGTSTLLSNTNRTIQCSLPSNLYGRHDGQGCNAIEGWAWNGNDPNGTVNVDIYDGAVLIGTVAATLYRQDLADMLGSAYHGFLFHTPPSLRDGQPHTITIKFGGTNTNLPLDTPRTTSCTSSMPNYQGNLDAADCNTISGYAWDGNDDQGTINAAIYVDGNFFIVVPAQEAYPGIGTGYHGFKFAVPASLKNGQPHSIQVKFSGTPISLSSSPKTINCSP